MQDTKRDIPFFYFGFRIAIAMVMSVFLAWMVCAQEMRGQNECENLLNEAARAEEANDLIEAEFRYEECQKLARKYRLPKMEASALHRLAVIRAKNKKFTESANLFRRSLELAPKNAFVLSDFAQLYADRKDYGEAEKLLKKALDADPNNPKILFNLGIIIATQRPEKQTEGLRYLKLAVGEAEAYRELARICRAKGDIIQAENMEQKAKLAESRATNDIAGSSSDIIPARLPQRATHQTQTPPENMNRVRQEIADSYTREIIGAPQQQAGRSPVAQMPYIPTPVNLTPDASTVFPSSAAEKPQQLSPMPPVDPFASAVQRHETASSTVRQLEAPAATAFAQTTIRTLPSQSDSTSDSPSSAQSGIHDPFAPVQAADNNSTSGSSGVQLIRISSPSKTELKSPQQPRTSFSDSPKKDAPSIRVLPTIQGEFNRAQSIERVEANNKEKESNDVGNPLRQTLLGSSNTLDSASDTSVIASLPSFSAVGSKRIPRIDQNIIQGLPENTPDETETSLSAQPNGMISLENVREAKNGVAQTKKPLPVREVNVPQSSPVAVVRRDVPVKQSPTSPLGIEGRTIANLNPENAKTVSNDRRFASGNTPNVLKFNSFSGNLPLTEKPNEVAVRTLIQNDLPQGARPIIRLPQIAVDDSDFSKTALDNSPSVARVHVFPVMENQLANSEAPTLSAVPADPFPIMAEQPKPIVLLEPMEVAVMPSNPYTIVEYSPQFTEVRRIEPQAIAMYRPAPVADVSTSTSPLLEYSPALVEVKKQESLLKVTPLPTETEKVAEIKTLPSLSTLARELPKPLPGTETPSGFASTRTPGSKIATSDDQTTGFARSRK